MKTALYLMALLLAFPVFSQSIEATRSGVIDTKVNDFYTLITIPLETMHVSEDLSRGYVLLSNGVVMSPMVSAPCKAFQVFQMSVSEGKLSGKIVIDVQGTLENKCEAEVQKILDAETIKVSFKTALFADGTGTNMAPVELTIQQH